VLRFLQKNVRVAFHLEGVQKMGAGAENNGADKQQSKEFEIDLAFQERISFLRSVSSPLKKGTGPFFFSLPCRGYNHQPSVLVCHCLAAYNGLRLCKSVWRPSSASGISLGGRLAHCLDAHDVYLDR